MSIAEAYRAEGLLPYDQLPDITDPAWDPNPLVVERLGAAGQYLLAMGLAHRSDRGNLHYRTLNEYADGFMLLTDRDNRVIIHEGMGWQAGESLDLAYAEGGEPQWLVTLGEETGTPVVSAELPYDGADLLLAEGLTHREIAGYYFDRQVPQYWRATKRPSFENYIQGKMTRRKEMLEWDFDFSLPNLIAIHEGIHQRRFDPTDSRFFYRQSVGYMLKPTNRIQLASIVCNMGRDLNLLRMHQQYFDQGVSVVSGFGWSHIRALHPRLEQLGTHGETSLVTAADLGSLTLGQYVYQ